MGFFREIRNIGVVKTLSGAPARVARALLEGGPATVTGLAHELGLSTTAVRRHIDALDEAGFIEATERPPFGTSPSRGRGRPAKTYAVTSVGRDAFDQAYDDVAVGALRFLADKAGPTAVLEFARNRAAELETRYAATVGVGRDQRERAALLAKALSADGYAATSEYVPAGGAQLCQHHCPVAHVAEEFPQLCEAETEAFSRLLGTHVMRLATIAHGDGVCTTHIPAHQRETDPQAQREIQPATAYAHSRRDSA